MPNDTETPPPWDKNAERLTALESQVNLMSQEPPTLTQDQEINTKLIQFYWVMIILIFVSQCIGFLIQVISNTIDWTLFGILVLGAFQTLIIGGAAKLVTQQMEALSKQANNSATNNKTLKAQVASQTAEIEELRSQLNNRDAEILAMKLEHNE